MRISDWSSDVCSSDLLEQHAEGVADIVRMKFGKAFGAVAALKQEGLALRHAAELARQLARFTREDERRIVCELAFGGRERTGVAVGGQLARLVRKPAMRRSEARRGGKE